MKIVPFEKELPTLKYDGVRQVSRRDMERSLRYSDDQQDSDGCIPQHFTTLGPQGEPLPPPDTDDEAGGSDRDNLMQEYAAQKGSIYVPGYCPLCSQPFPESCSAKPDLDETDEDDKENDEEK